MNKQPAISSVQLSLLAAGSAMMFPYTFLPILRSGPANHDVWICLLIAIVFIVFLSIPALFLANKFKGININEINELIMGKAIGKVTASVFFIFALFCSIACMLMTVLFVNIYVLPETPAWAILVIVLIPLIYASYNGAGVIARLATFIVPLIMLTIIFFFIMGIQDMELKNILPVAADSQLSELVMGGFITASRYSEIMIILIFSYFLKKNASINKTYVRAVIIFGISFLIILMSVLLVIGSDLGKISNNAYFLFTRQVGGYDFIQRVQSFNILAWFTGTILKLMTYNYMASFVLSGIIKKKPQHFYVIPIGIVGFIVCMLPFMQRTSTLHFMAGDIFFPYVVLGVIFGIPLILITGYLIRKKKVESGLTSLLEQKAQGND